MPGVRGRERLIWLGKFAVRLSSLQTGEPTWRSETTTADRVLYLVTYPAQLRDRHFRASAGRL